MERPKRLEPSKASGWSNYCEKKREAVKTSDNDTFWSSFITNSEDEEHTRKILDKRYQIEKEQEEEDTTMLIRLVKIRQSLWT
ncbi:MAG: hypothetical protein ABI597_11390 [Gammaproteobacteria bacterium]